jgi:hypothetical protein
MRGRLLRAATVLAFAWPTVGLHGQTAPSAQAAWTTYRDPQGRFSFDHPSTFGQAGPGTNDGFVDRVAAVRFVNVTGLGGEVVLTRGRIVMDVQALGGLYDPIALEVFPDAMRQQIVAVLPAVAPQNVCAMLGSADHVGPAPALPANVRDAAKQIDRMRHGAPHVVRCEVRDRVVVFHKESDFELPGESVRQHTFGAMRFLDGQYSAFQTIRVRPTAPSPADLEVLERIARSFRR